MDQFTVGVLFAVTTGICWALLALALKQALHYSSSGTIAWIRLVVAFLILLVFYAWRDRQRLKILWRAKPLVIVAGLGLAANYFAYMKGIENTGASNAQIMIQLGPIGLLVAGILFFRERPSRQQVLGLTLAGLGFGLFFWDQILATIADSERFLTGDLWLVVASLAWAIFASLQKGLKGDWTAQQFNMVIYGICTLALWPMARFEEIATWTPGVWVLMLACGLNTLVAYGSFAEALRRIPASHVSVIISANPLLTILLVTLLAKYQVSWITPEPIAWRGFIGALFVVAGVCLTVWRRPARPRAGLQVPANSNTI